MVLATIISLGTIVPLYLWGSVETSTTGLNGGFETLDKQISLLALIPAAIIIWLVFFIYANLAVYLYVHRAGMPVGATSQLKDIWPDVAGYKLFLQETEYVRLQSDQDSRDPAMAYCLALGLDPGFISSLPKS